ncbi:Hypothetical protein F387_01710 [Wohlfahrtiimonas chitiniclastica SH04]|uniref:DUF1778 domain-containing protein n=1 Tax=Wohlfahrtiimonas chitiniclastica SH04 TaxID=1261130 RepID=L8XWI8_9GAMM|nr:DUF1778 domain-containing protein [Wohlfahrtiimonas chitiniclastica]ELV08393.1 Hypothetical protein F387_01710 [Wohlfahrtiimonas chitiniclastica SH04]
MTTKTERIEAIFLPEVKRSAERAALTTGLTLMEYLSKLVQENAPKTFNAYHEIVLTNQQFANFLATCEVVQPPSKKIKQAAALLDKEGF